MRAKRADANADDDGSLRYYYEVWNYLIDKLKQDPRYPLVEPNSVDGKD